MLRVLLVDDDAPFLALLRDRLEGRAPWAVEVATGSDEALVHLAQANFDVVAVAHERVAGLDLLARVRLAAPRTGRVLFAGELSDEDATRAAGVAHQVVLKSRVGLPLLATAIDAARRLADVYDTDLRIAIGSVSALPTPPRLYVDLCGALDQSDAALAGRVLSRDAALSAQVLKIVNSAYFGLRRPVAEVSRAVLCLGQSLLRGLVLRHEIERAALALSPELVSVVEEHNVHALHVAELAAAMSAPADRGEAYTAGLLHDVGKLVIAASDCSTYLGIRAMARRLDATELCVERMRYGVSHAEVGASLLELWGLPSALHDAVLTHHEVLPRFRRRRTLADIVGLAEQLAERTGGVSVREVTSAGVDDELWAHWVDALQGAQAA